MSNHRAPSPTTAADALDAPVDPATCVTGPNGAVARTVASEALFRGAIELRIDHGGVIYRLKQTALGKLILTK